MRKSIFGNSTTPPPNFVRYRLGQRVRYLTHHCDAKITGFMMNQPEPEDPESNLFLTQYNINLFPNLLVAPLIPDPQQYHSLEIGFLHTGSFCHFEVHARELEPLLEPLLQAIVTLVAIDQQSSINIITVSDENEEHVLYGDFRMTQPMQEYIGKQIRVNVNNACDWTWSPLDEFEAETDE